MKRWTVIAGAAVVALVVAGFILGGYMDASGASSIPGLGVLARLPTPLRLAVEIAVGVPLAFGIALYAITQTLEFLMFITSPVRKLVGAVARSYGRGLGR